MIKVMIDTNILISSALFPKGKVAKAYLKVVQPHFSLMYVIILLKNYVVSFVKNFQIRWFILMHFFFMLFKL